MTRLRIVLALIGWTVAVAGFFYWGQREDPLPPCNDVFTRLKAACTAPAPIEVDLAYVAIAGALWASGMLVGFIGLRLHRRGRQRLGPL